MNFQERIEASILKKKSKDPVEAFHEICFMLAHEFGWSYDEIVNSPIPFIIGVSEELNKFNKKQNALNKKKR